MAGQDNAIPLSGFNQRSKFFDATAAQYGACRGRWTEAVTGNLLKRVGKKNSAALQESVEKTQGAI